MKISGKTAWITGASSGIGEAIAYEFFNRGAHIILSARSVDKLARIKETFDKLGNGRCTIIPCDVTNEASVKQAASDIKRQGLKVDILVNNAGVSQRSEAVDTDISVTRQLMEVNFFGAVMITKSVLPDMIAQKGGHIVVISSMAGKYGFRMRSAYSASKHALHGYFETLRAELHDRQIEVTLICPGRINTDISIHSLTGDGSMYGKMDKGQQGGIPVDKCARIIARATENGRKEVFIGRAELLLLYIKRVCPALYYKIVNKASPV